MKINVLAALVIGVGIVAGCAYPGGGSADYRRYEARGEQSVRFGVVESVRNVNINAGDTGVGTAAGAVIGGVAGSHAGRGSGEIVGTIAGAILGGVIGQNIEQSANERKGIEITVLLDSGKYIAVVQEGDEYFRSGERVRILSGRGSTRVTH